MAHGTRILAQVARSTAGRVAFVVGLALNLLGVITLLFDTGLPVTAWLALGFAVLFVAAFWELLARTHQVDALSVDPDAPGSPAWLKANTATISERVFGPVERNAQGAVVAGNVEWPNGVQGSFTADSVDAASGGVDAYTVTYEPTGSAPARVRQPAVTRNLNGAVVDRPHLVVEI